jgi:hypothetical protein
MRNIATPSLIKQACESETKAITERAIPFAIFTIFSLIGSDPIIGALINFH